MRFPSPMDAKRRLMTGSLIVLGFIGPMLFTGTSARATEGELDNDARVEGFGGKSMIVDTGTAPDFLLLSALAVLAVCVTFKDAKRITRKK